MIDERPASPSHVWHPRHVSWLTIALALLAVGTFLAISRPNMRYYTLPTMGGGMESTVVYPAGGATSYRENTMITADMVVPSAPSSVSIQGGMGGGMKADYYPYYQNPNVPATDARELLKVYYNASMTTRDVQGLTRRVETTVRGFDGRIDQQSSSPQSGFVSFVVPVSKYDAFRTELEGLVGSRFLSVNIQSQNMLPQKQSIEEQQKQADSSLAGQKAARQKLVTAHASTVKSLQSQIDADAQELASLRAQTQTYEIQVQIQAVAANWAALKQQLANENASYAVQLKNADANIQYAEDWQTAVQKQDTALMDDVATVNGSVSISWISMWDMAQLYLPGYWIPTIFAVLSFLSYLYDRRRFATV